MMQRILPILAAAAVLTLAAPARAQDADALADPGTGVEAIAEPVAPDPEVGALAVVDLRVNSTPQGRR